MNRRALLLSAAIAMLVLSCNDNPTSPDVSPVPSATASVQHPSPPIPDSISNCPGCIVNLQLVRARGEPLIRTVRFPGDPHADYVIDVDDHGSRDALGYVWLNGTLIVRPRDLAHPGPFHLHQAVQLRAKNVISAGIVGRPGSVLTIQIIAPANGPQLLSPAQGAYIYQYAAAPFCGGSQYGFQVNFDWTDVPGAVSYLIYYKGPNPAGPVLNDVATTSSQYTYTGCSAYVATANAQGWQWHVTAVFADGSSVVSPTGTFNFTDPFQGANGPQLLSPAQGAYIYQYAAAPFCGDSLVYGFQINFDWTDVPGAAYYLIYYKWPNVPFPVLNDVATTPSQYTFTDCGAYVDYGNGQGWQWHVTAVFPDGSRVVSQTGTFNFTDPFQP